MKIAKFILIPILGVIFYTLFLPYFETTYFGNEDALISNRQEGQEGGFFGVEIYYTYKGFGSLHAIFNVTISSITTLLFLLNSLGKIFFRIFISLFILSHIALIVLNSTAGYLLSPPDTYKIGFILLVESEIVLFILIYRFSKWRIQK
ncbi:MAG: hypothetical protein ACK46Y_10090, partial [Fluviicola sp.]